MTNYEKIKAACIKANPRLLELSFGCWVDIGEGEPYYTQVLRQLESNVYSYNQHTNRKYEGMQDVIEFLGNFYYDRTPLGEIKEILGHEPELSDVLNVIWNHLPSEKRWIPARVVVLVVSKWDFTKPVKDQSEELLQFIADLL